MCLLYSMSWGDFHFVGIGNIVDHHCLNFLCFVGIGNIVDHHCLNFLFMIYLMRDPYRYNLIWPAKLLAMELCTGNLDTWDGSVGSELTVVLCRYVTSSQRLKPPDHRGPILNHPTTEAPYFERYTFKT